MGRKLITAPTDEPLELSEVKNALRVEIEDDDNLIRGLIEGARVVFEQETARILVSSTWEYYLDIFNGDEIELPHSPIQSITSIKYYDLDGVEQTFSSNDYELDNTVEPGLVRLKWWDDKTWPSTQSRANAVTIRYVAGYGSAASVPEPAKEAMRLLVGHWYENREDSLVGNYTRNIPRGFKSLVYSMKVYTFP